MIGRVSSYLKRIKLPKLIKAHKRISLAVLILIIVSAIAMPVIQNKKREALNNAIGKEYWERRIAECKQKSTENNVTYAYGSWVNEMDTAAITIHADTATDVKPEIFIDGVKASVAGETKSAYECQHTGSTYYKFSAKVPSTCTEKEVTLKADGYELTKTVDNKNYGCKTKSQKDAEELAKAQEEQQKRESKVNNNSQNNANQDSGQKTQLGESAAEQYCQDAALLGKYLDLDKVSIIAATNYGKQYVADGSYDKDRYPITMLRWNGKYKQSGKTAVFSCWVSGDKNDIRLHRLDFDGTTLAGSTDYDIYDKEGEVVH